MKRLIIKKILWCNVKLPDSKEVLAHIVRCPSMTVSNGVKGEKEHIATQKKAVKSDAILNEAQYNVQS
jgi:hypothetical protein